MLNRNGILDLLLYFSLIAFGKTPFQQDKTATEFVCSVFVCRRVCL